MIKEELDDNQREEELISTPYLRRLRRKREELRKDLTVDYGPRSNWPEHHSDHMDTLDKEIQKEIKEEQNRRRQKEV